jgi:hypothetical protein
LQQQNQQQHQPLKAHGAEDFIEEMKPKQDEPSEYMDLKLAGADEEEEEKKPVPFPISIKFEREHDDDDSSGEYHQAKKICLDLNLQ